MKYEQLDGVSGIGKKIIIRDKYTGRRFRVGAILDEVSVSDGDQKYVVQFIPLADTVTCDDDPTRHVLRIGYYTRRSDGYFCLGSQFTPIVTPTEWQSLVTAVREKRWLETINEMKR